MIGCVVLAAGLSRRFSGGNKLLHEIGGRPMMSGVLDAAAGIPDSRAVVVASDPQVGAQAAARGFAIVMNPTPENGVSGSIRLGLSALLDQGELTGCLFAVADQPYLTAASLRAIRQCHMEEPTAIVALSYAGKRGNPVLFPADCFPALMALTGDTGGSAVLQANMARLRLCQAKSRRELCDFDTQQALKKQEETGMFTGVLQGTIIDSKKLGELCILENGSIVVEKGVIQGVYQTLPKAYRALPVTQYGDALIIPSFSDMHLHAPQYAMLGLGMDLQLLDWLNTYTFKTESRFSDNGFARQVYRALAKTLVDNGTTRVMMFASIHREATHILMEELEAAGVTGYVGKVNMDRNSPDYLIETTQESIAETRRWLEECHYEHVKPAITPRFTPSCTDVLMKGLGALAAEYHAPVQSHLSENIDEIQWVQELCPNCGQYWETYEKAGLFTSGAVMAHCVYSDERERAAIKRHNVWVAHCPDSNINIATGVAPIRRMLDEGLHVALGSDIGGGSQLSMMDVATAAIRASKRNWLATEKKERFLSVAEAFYLITSAGQQYFGAGPGFAAGDALHALVISDEALPPTRALTSAERLERVMYIGTSACIKERFSAGRKL